MSEITLACIFMSLLSEVSSLGGEFGSDGKFDDFDFKLISFSLHLKL